MRRTLLTACMFLVLLFSVFINTSLASASSLHPLTAHHSASAAHITLGTDPSSSCAAGTAKKVVYQYQTEWFTRDSVNDLSVWVEYWWCARWSGDTVGLNWSHGMVYVGGNAPVCYTIEYGSNWTTAFGGAMMQETNGSVVGDGQGYTNYNLCSSSGNYAILDDYSLTTRGDLAYSAQIFIWAAGPNYRGPINAQSPTF